MADQEDPKAEISLEQVELSILTLRSERVMLDADLAELYQVETKKLLQAVRRNAERFPGDFMFQLTPDEWESLRSQFVTSKGRGGRQYRPYAFTEQGVAMLSSVLRSPRAIRANIEIMRAFVRLRRIVESREDLARKLIELEKKYDRRSAVVFEAIRQLMAEPPDGPAERIGFRAPSERDSV